MSDTSSVSSFSYDIVFGSNEIRCDECLMFFPYCSINEHIALNHKSSEILTKDKQLNESKMCISATFEKPHCSVPLNNIAPVLKKSQDSLSLKNITDTIATDIEKPQRSLPLKKIANTIAAEASNNNVDDPKEVIDLTKVDDKPDEMNRSEFLDRKVRKKRNAQNNEFKNMPNLISIDVMDDAKMEFEETSIDKEIEKKFNNTTSHSKTMNSKKKKQSRRQSITDPKKIPSVFEMFNITQSMSDISLAFQNGYDVIEPSEVGHRKRSMPGHCIECPHCSNIMHKDHLKGHILRKHTNNDTGIPAANDGYHKCIICSNLMPKEHIRAHIERSHGNGKHNKDHFLRCKLCTATMHIDYMPGHLLRKHKSHGGSVGIVWSQYTDQQIYEWFKNGEIIIRNGAIYIGHRNIYAEL